MKYSKYIGSMGLIGALSLLLLGCEKKIVLVAGTETAGANSNFAHLRVVHASPNLASLAGTTTDLVNVWVGGNKINGARLGYAGLFPANFPTGYAAIAPGNQDIKLSLQGVANLDSTQLFTMTQNLRAGRFYSFIITDNLNNPNDSSRIFVEDNFVQPAFGRMVIRFANALNDTATDKRVDVFSARRNANLFAGVSAGSVTAFSNQPFINLPDTLILRRAGTSTELARINNITFANARVYTLFARGNTAEATGAKARALAWYVHR